MKAVPGGPSVRDNQYLTIQGSLQNSSLIKEQQQTWQSTLSLYIIRFEDASSLSE